MNGDVNENGLQDKDEQEQEEEEEEEMVQEVEKEGTLRENASRANEITGADRPNGR